MRKVAITQGTYGYKPVGALHVKPKTRYDEPFELDDAEAARIVALGIAEYVSQDVATPLTPLAPLNPSDPNGDHGTTLESTGNGNPALEPDIPKYSDSSTVAELRAVGKLVGLTFAVGTTKKQMMNALDELCMPDDDDEEMSDDEVTDDEEPPTPGVEELVT